MKRLKTGFTLAEVLITLGIIGVVAAITMPNLIGNYQYKTVGVKLAKFAAQLESAARAHTEQFDSFDTNNDCESINEFLNNNFIIKNSGDLEEQEIERTGSDGTKTKEKITSAVYIAGNVPARTSTANGWSGVNGKFEDDQTNALLLKDGTKMYVYPKDDYAEQDEINTRQVGEVIFGVTFSPEIKGLPSAAQQSFDFVVTELGYVFPNAVEDFCTAAIAAEEFNTNARTFNKGQACAKANN